MDKLYIVMPAYNEEENIHAVVEDWYPIIEQVAKGNPESRLVIVDDGSKDQTYKILEELAKDRPYLQPITKPNSGHGATVLYAYHYALEHGADYIFQTDSDGQTIPSEFVPFWEERDQYDMIIGFRNHRQDGFSRVVVTKVLRFVLWVSFGVWITDANTPFRLMEANSLKENIALVPENFNLSNVILSVLYVKKKQKVKFVPITFRPRQGGVNSINLKRIVSIGKQALVDFAKIRKQIATSFH